MPSPNANPFEAGVATVQAPSGRLTARRRVLGLLGYSFFLVALVPALGFATFVGLHWLESRAPGLVQRGLMGLVESPGAGLALMGALGLYGLSVLTNGFVRRFDRPYWIRARRVIWSTHTIITILGTGGVAFLTLHVLWRVKQGGVSLSPVLFFSIFAALLLAFVVASFVWNPWDLVVKNQVRRRLEARGLSAQAADGFYCGVSDPDRTSRFRMVVEEDVGVLCLQDHALVFLGDRGDLSIPRRAVESLAQEADAGIWTCYLGAAYPCVEFEDEAGQRRRVRLHAFHGWMNTHVARAQTELTSQISTWLEHPPR